MEKMEQKFVVCEKMESDDEAMTIVGWGSKPTIDRDRELIESSAWNLDNFRKNPVLLLCHQYNFPPIGKCIWVKAVPGQGLRFKAKFANTERGRECYELYKSEIMSAFSVGFKPRPGGVIDNPTDVKYKGCKKVFTDVELMEISCVPVPAHADALVDHVKAGKIVTKQLKEEMEAIVEIIEKSDDTLEIEIKATDEETNTEVKTELVDSKSEEEVLEDVEKELALIDTKAVTPNEDESEKDFMERCMGDKSMAKLNEGFRTNACKLMWKKGTAKDVIVEETKAMMPMKPLKDEDMKTFMARCMTDETMMTDNPKDEDRNGACQIMWDKVGGKKDAAEDSETVSKDSEAKVETVAEFLKRLLLGTAQVLETPDDLIKLVGKAGTVDELKATVAAMEAQAMMEPDRHPVVADIEKSADAEGNPSLYDLTGAVDRALNPMRGSGLEETVPTSVNPINPPYRLIIDIFAVNYPSGHVVYSEYDKVNRLSRYFQIDYEYDKATRTASIAGDPEEVLQSWISERYMTTEEKDEDDIETKAGKVLSAKNKKILSDCMAQMMAAHTAMEEMMKMAEGVPDEEKEVDDIEEKEEFDIIEKEEEMIEFDLEHVEKADDGLLEIDDATIRDAISNVLTKNASSVDVKGIIKEAFAKASGRATL